MVTINKKFVIKFIINLIHPKSPVNIDNYIFNNQSFLNNILRVGSSNLIIPAIYVAIKRKKLTSFFPDDFLDYLRLIYEINVNRNSEVTNQIHFIGSVFKKNKINYIFLKGAAILLMKPSDLANVRMIGDIDILVCGKDLLRAKKILEIEGFKQINSQNDKFSDQIHDFEKKNRHLERMISKDFICAVELHREVLTSKFKHILPSHKLLNNKRKINNYWTGSQEHMWQHSIMDWQYNDYGSITNSLSLKSVFDVLHLEPVNLKISLDKHDKSILQFYSLLSLFIDKYSTGFKFRKFLYSIQLRFHRLDFLFQKSVIFYIWLFSKIKTLFLRSILFFRSNEYRIRILKSPKKLFSKLLRFLKD